MHICTLFSISDLIHQNSYSCFHVGQQLGAASVSTEVFEMANPRGGGLYCIRYDMSYGTNFLKCRSSINTTADECKQYKAIEIYNCL